VARPLLWLGLGLVLLVLVAVLIAPLEAVGPFLGLAAIAVVPGLLVLALTASARRRRTRDDPGTRPD
jgi:hypothetical protein